MLANETPAAHAQEKEEGGRLTSKAVLPLTRRPASGHQVWARSRNELCQPVAPGGVTASVRAGPAGSAVPPEAAEHSQHRWFHFHILCSTHARVTARQMVDTQAGERRRRDLRSLRPPLAVEPRTTNCTTLARSQPVRMAGALRVSARVPAEADGGGEVSTPLRELSAIFSIDLHPSRTLDLHAAVRDELNARLMRCDVPPSLCSATKRQPPRESSQPHARARRYDERLDGVMLAYWKEKLATESVRGCWVSAAPACGGSQVPCARPAC